MKSEWVKIITSVSEYGPITNGGVRACGPYVLLVVTFPGRKNKKPFSPDPLATTVTWPEKISQRALRIKKLT